MDSLILFSISYVILFILYIFLFYIMGLKMKKILNSNQVRFLKVRFGLKDKDLNPKTIGFIICLIDPLIISLTGTIVSLPKWNYVLELLLGFVILIALIYSFYEILGRIIKRKVDRNEHKRNRK
ncbi:MAG: hypothetical protein IJD92_02260 [Bacilli bacterium]|nr:hypothetical protein [Bacilli bacterium]